MRASSWTACGNIRNTRGAKFGFLFVGLRVIREVEKSILRAGAGTGRGGREDGFSR